MRRNMIMTILVLGVIIYVFYMIPRLNTGQNELREYDHYSEFYDDFVAGHIAEVMVINGEELEGTFKPEAPGGYDRFVVSVQGEDVMNTLMTAKQEHELDTAIGAEPMRLSDRILTIAGTYLLPLVIIILFWLFMVRQMNTTRGQALNFGRSQARMVGDHWERVTFDDVAGMQEVKEEMQEVVAFLREPERFRKLGAKIPRGVLLVGPPGCGKTLLARAVAGEAGVAFFYMSGSDFVEMFVGVGASRVRDLFEQAKDHLPAIIFIDELDAVGRLRGAGLGGGHDEREQTLNALLVEMDGFDPNDDVILLAATNRPDILDPALLRPGRFDRQIVVPMPDVKERQEILNIYVQDKRVSDELDLEVLARRSVGFSGADIENMVNEAALLAGRKDKDVIESEDFDEAIERIIAGPERKSRVISEDERKVLAYHEAGHALVGYTLPDFDSVYKVTILPRGMSLGYTISLPEDDRYITSKSEMLNRMTQALGGRAAEELVLGEIHTGAHQDLEVVSKIARAMVTEYGMSEELGPITYGRKTGPVFLGKDLAEERNYSEAVARKIDNAVRAMVDGAHDRARAILEKHREELDLLVEKLLEHETLDQADVEALLEHGVMAEELEEESEEEAEEADEQPAEPLTPEEVTRKQRGAIPPGMPEPETP
ncbi:MAG: ATP-dependent zinc metalloprotease FtsH [Armatimonadota bacterium]|nr:ATP-dependent zinc metalloprotease FtsH [Armatimonadota bacterium]